jgi:hypothetical protein
MARLMRIMRAAKLGNLNKGLQTSESMEKIRNFFVKYGSVTRLMRSMFIVLIMAHFIACMWYFSAKLDNFEPDTWVVRNELQDKDNGTLYMFSLYWSITTLTTVGFGDINARTNSERIICIIWMMFGVGFYSFTVGSISSVLSSIDTEASLVEERVEMI